MSQQHADGSKFDSFEALVRKGDKQALSQLLEAWHPADITLSLIHI